MKINEYIESGILESYVLGSASEVETKQLFTLKSQYPEIEDALHELEFDLERIAQNMSITPPPDTWMRIEEQMNELVQSPEFDLIISEQPPQSDTKRRKKGQFIEVEAESNYMRLHKIWRWIFVAVFFLGKLFLAFAIYYYLEHRQERDEIEQLKIELKNYKNP